MDQELMSLCLQNTIAPLKDEWNDAAIGYLTIEITEDFEETGIVYFRDMEYGRYVLVSNTSKLVLLITTDYGIGFVPVTGKDVMTRKGRDGQLLFGGFDAMLSKEEGSTS